MVHDTFVSWLSPSPSLHISCKPQAHACHLAIQNFPDCFMVWLEPTNQHHIQSQWLVIDYALCLYKSTYTSCTYIINHNHNIYIYSITVVYITYIYIYTHIYFSYVDLISPATWCSRNPDRCPRILERREKQAADRDLAYLYYRCNCATISICASVMCICFVYTYFDVMMYTYL